MNDERRCPRCGSLAATEGMSTATLMNWSAFYDKNGNYHNENPNITTTTYTCSDCGQNYSMSNRYGESKLSWNKDDVYKPISELKPFTVSSNTNGFLVDGGLKLSGDTNFQGIKGLMPLNDKSRFVISGDIELELQSENKKFTINLKKLIQLLTKEGVIKE